LIIWGGRYTWWGVGLGIGWGEQNTKKYSKATQIDYPSGTVFLVEKNLFFQLGGFDERFRYFYEDVDFGLRAFRYAVESWCLQSSIACHMRGASFNNLNIDNRQQHILFFIRRNRWLTILKNFSGIERLVRLFLLGLVTLIITGRDLFLNRLDLAKINLKSVWEAFNIYGGELVEKRRLKEVMTVVRKKKKNKITWLDLGCGSGAMVRMARNKGFIVTGIDRKISIQNNMWLIEADIENYQYDSKYEIVSLYHVLEHLKNPKKLLKKIRHFLQPNGLLVIEVPLVGNLSERLLKQHYLAYRDQTHKWFWKKQEFLELLDQTGWRVIGKGKTWMQMPLSTFTSSFDLGWKSKIAGVVCWLPLKLLGILGLNDEFLRVYCIQK
jgi:2-polyprenyl-3-methyl-5-hydroxy-6-metoxy-1,4-benzoquinol methylase